MSRAAISSRLVRPTLGEFDRHVTMTVVVVFELDGCQDLAIGPSWAVVIRIVSNGGSVLVGASLSAVFVAGVDRRSCYVFFFDNVAFFKLNVNKCFDFQSRVEQREKPVVIRVCFVIGLRVVHHPMEVFNELLRCCVRACNLHFDFSCLK